MPAQLSIILFILLGVFLALNIPIAIALGFSAMLIIWKAQLGMQILSYNFYSGIAKFPLLAIPFFIAAGIIMERAGIAERLINLMRVLVGKTTGGLAIAAVATAMFWGAVSGSGPATTAALGVILIPGMAAVGYGIDFAAALVAASSSLAIIIPPSIAFIIYGVLTDTSVGALFAAGIIPGAIVGIALMTAAYIVSRKRGFTGGVERKKGDISKAFKEAFWGLIAPLIILGGIYGGVFTPTEAASVAVFYGIFVGTVIYKKITFKDLFKIFIDTAEGTAVVMLVVTLAGIFSWAASAIGVINKATELIMSVSSNPHIILLLINIMLLIAGMFLDAISIYYVFLPIFLPILAKLGWHPIWFGVIMTINLAIGQVTPPVAVNLYVGANVAKRSLEDVSREVWPFLIAAIIALIFLAYVPSLTLFLPKLFGLM